MNRKNARWTAITVCMLLTIAVFSAVGNENARNLSFNKEKCSVLQDESFQIPTSTQETVTLPAAKDSHVNPTYRLVGGHVWYERDVNNGNYPQLLIHETTHPANGESCSWIYIQFDTSPIPRGARVLSATLRLFYLFANCWGVGTLDQSQPHEVYRVLGVWEENTITWRGWPQVSTVASASTNVNRMEGYYRNLNFEEAWIEWDVTSDVQQFVGGTSVNHGWCIRDTASFPGRQSYVYKYSSKESFLLYILSTGPELVVTYSTENNPPDTPTRPAGPTSGNVGQSLRYESTFSDPDGDSMNIMWDWGDGTPTEWYGVITSGLTVGAYHSWNSPRTYQVRTRARDIPFGAVSGWSPALTVTINGGGNNPPNTPTRPSGPTAGNIGVTLFYETVTTDPDGDSLEYMIDWGDGTDTGWVGIIASGTPFQTFHSWNAPGIYQVSAIARDIPHYAESNWSPSLTVTIS